MTVHTTWSSAETAAASPLATWLRRVARGEILTIRTETIKTRLNYASNQVVIAYLRELERFGVLKFSADRGPEAVLTIRVIL